MKTMFFYFSFPCYIFLEATWYKYLCAVCSRLGRTQTCTPRRWRWTVTNSDDEYHDHVWRCDLDMDLTTLEQWISRDKCLAKTDSDIASVNVIVVTVTVTSLNGSLSVSSMGLADAEMTIVTEQSSHFSEWIGKRLSISIVDVVVAVSQLCLWVNLDVVVVVVDFLTVNKSLQKPREEQNRAFSIIC